MNRMHNGTENHLVHITIDSIALKGNLIIPENAKGVVVFAHGSGSSRCSPRNRFVAQMLREGGLATLLMDLLTVEEEEMDRRTGRLRFNIELLAERLIGATDWLVQQPEAKGLNIGYFGASTGAAAALIAATERQEVIKAVVSRGGRPDLAGSSLPLVKAPTLLIVGGNDFPVLELSHEAMLALRRAEKRLEVVPGATHLFEEPGALEQVAALAREWFQYYLGGKVGEKPRMLGKKEAGRDYFSPSTLQFQVYQKPAEWI